jgi:hypothetical protein
MPNYYCLSTTSYLVRTHKDCCPSFTATKFHRIVTEFHKDLSLVGSLIILMSITMVLLPTWSIDLRVELVEYRNHPTPY